MLKRLAAVCRNTGYIRCFRCCSLKKNTVLMESKHGEDLGGNIFYLLKEMAERQNFRLYLSIKKEKRRQVAAWIERENIEGVIPVEPGSPKYYQLLAQAQYLFTDTSFPPRYIKKEGQILTNTWHGTPMKAMGQEDRSEGWAMGNIQRNLLLADYLIFPNSFMEEKMLTAYGLTDLYSGQILREEYPRNSVLTEEAQRRRVRQALGIDRQEVIIYMPTWRGQSTGQAELQREKTEEFLEAADQKLKENQLLYVKLHPFIKEKLCLTEYKHIRPFPTEWETYQVLSAADRLVTDYSSVLFDFMNTGRPILLYAYDEKEYEKQRGLYLRPEDLSLPVAYTATEAAEGILRAKPVPLLRRQEFCPYESAGAAARIIDRVTAGQSKERRKRGKEAVLFFGGEWLKNGITTAALNLLEQGNTEDTAYYVAYDQNKLKKEPSRLRQLPEKVTWFPMSGGMQYTVGDMVWLGLYYFLHWTGRWLQQRVDRFFLREKERLFGSVSFDRVIQFEGYGRSMTQLFQQIPGVKVIFVHNNMERELAKKKNQDPLVLRRAYTSYDRVAVVTEDLIPSTAAVGAPPERIRVVNNQLDAEAVRRRSQEPVSFDADTKASLNPEDLETVLSSEKVKIVTVGRFSPEKGHERLIRAFEEFHKKYADSELIIIGGYGPLYEETCRWKQESTAARHIHIIQSLHNPMPIIKRCQLFVLSSYYEGQGLTLLEADALGVPTLSVRVCGPTGIMERYGGYLVPDSTEGLQKGMEAFMEGQVPRMGIDFEEYNRTARKQYEALWKGTL